MSRMVLQRKHEVPPGGWSYTQFETGARLQAGSWIDLVAAVKKQRLANNLPIGADFEGEIEDQICQRMPPGICDREGQPTWGGGTLTREAIIEGTKALAAWVFTGRKKAEKAEIERRAAICASCFMNQPTDGCKSCGQGLLRETVNAIVGGDHFTGEHLLYACMACSCLLRAKVQLPLEFLQAHTSDEVNGRLPDHCWLKRKVA